MDPQIHRLARAKEIFADALERPAEDHAAFLNTACAGDPQLRAAVEALLDAHAAAARFMDSPSAAPQAAATDPGSPAERPGTHIGPYKLLDQIGEGGFGSVFMAEQTSPIVRRVAVKVIKLGMDTRQVIARFEAERQALAMMDHPNIARVLDAGATQTGRPYFVMELVRGDPITEYCDRNNLTTAQRLALFTDVCHAVQHAHQKGIIHRDIKPSNVLVTIFDGRPVPKVIDFGIAKAMNQRLTDKTLFTAHRQLIGTPQYMSPEQAEMSGGDVDTRADIYSLGVLLYELLTGTTPFHPEHLRSAALAEVQRIIREEEPEKPSTRLSQGAKVSMSQGVKKGTSAHSALDTSTPRHLDTSSVATRRRTDAAQLIRAVRGDLDWIAMKCLEKDRNRRYETANGVAMDVIRHLSGEPVVAAPPSGMYRVRKFVGKHRGVMTAGAVVAAAFLMGLAGTITFAVREASARADAEQGRTEAEKARAEANERRNETDRVAVFQAQMLAKINAPYAGARLMRDLAERHRNALNRERLLGADRDALAESMGVELARVNGTDITTVFIDQTILRPAIDAIDEQFKEQPVVDAVLRQALADLYVNLGMRDSAVPLVERALELRRRTLGDDHPDTVISMLKYSTMRSAPEAESLLREALERRRRVLGDGHPETLEAMSMLGGQLNSQGRFVESETVCRAAVDGLRRAPGEYPLTLIAALENLGRALEGQRRFDEAEACLREMLDKSRRRGGNEDPHTITSINSLGNFLFNQRRFAECQQYTRETVTLSKRVWGEDHPSSIGAIWNLGFLLSIMGRFEDAEPYYRELLERRARVFGENHPETLFAKNELGKLLVDLDHADEGERLLRDAAERLRRLRGPDHADTLGSMDGVGRALLAQGRLAEAETILRESLAVCQHTLDERDLVTYRTMRTLGEVLYELGRPDEAEPLLRAALERFVATLGESGTVKTRVPLGRALAIQARFAEAEEQFLRAEAAFPNALAATPKQYRQCLESIISLYEVWDKSEPGKGYDAKAVAWRERLSSTTPDAPR